MLFLIDPRKCFGHKSDSFKVARYQKALIDGANFPPIEVLKIKDKFLILDGVHRTQAHLLNGEPEILAFVYEEDDCPKRFLIGRKITLI